MSLGDGATPESSRALNQPTSQRREPLFRCRNPLGRLTPL